MDAYRTLPITPIHASKTTIYDIRSPRWPELCSGPISHRHHDRVPVLIGHRPEIASFPGRYCSTVIVPLWDQGQADKYTSMAPLCTVQSRSSVFTVGSHVTACTLRI